MIKSIFLSITLVSSFVCASSNQASHALDKMSLEEQNLLIIRDKMEDLEEFRILSDPYPESSKKIIFYFNDHLPTREGLEDLKVSGSAQFSEAGLSKLLKILKQKSLLLFDLREEPHGFINELPVSWIQKNGIWPNYDESSKQIEDEEKDLLKIALKDKNITIYKIIKNRSEDDEIFNDDFIATPTVVESISTERNLSAKMGLAYFRIPVTDHNKPKDDDIDAFMTYYLSKPEGSWTHIHCKGGRGRTSTFLTITDMLINAKKVSFEDIMDRQMRISQINMLVPASILQKKYKIAFLEKLEFLRQFYLYCKENEDNFKTSWTMWKSQHNQKSSTSSLEG
jgi:hypothetical protein